MTVSTKKILTLEEYFDFEYKSPIRNEYWNGILKPMTYTSPNHGRVVQNLARIIGNCLLETDKEIWTENRMVYIPNCNKVYYPDGVILENEPEYYTYKKTMQATLNPSVLIEVLSESNADTDRREKWECYQQISTLNQYVIIEQFKMFVEVYTRQIDNQWLYFSHKNADQTVIIGQCNIQLSDLYRKVQFPTPEELSEEEE